jgi:DNA invertase Pin-like site-specific DNA recombinase
MIALFGLFAEVERDLISERTKEGLAAARAQGRLLGRPKGSLDSYP